MSNLFSRGQGGRHDWKRFHADDVPCLEKNCYGNLRWSDRENRELFCDLCHKKFKVLEKI